MSWWAAVRPAVSWPAVSARTRKSRFACLRQGAQAITGWSRRPSASRSRCHPRPTTGPLRPFRSPGLNGRVGYQPRGKALGGSSAINAMVYIRGHRSDYDGWAALGNHGWAYDDVLPYFKKSENNESIHDSYHGVGGPLNVADLRTSNPFQDHFLEAGRQLQLPVTDDFNGADQLGLGVYQVTQKNGERWSAARAYIEPNLSRANLKVVTGAQARKVAFDGKRAIGIEFRPRRKNRIRWCQTGSHSEQRCISVTATADAVGYRPCTAFEGARHRSRASFALELAKISRIISTLHSATVPGASIISAFRLPASANYGGKSGVTGATAWE